MNIGKEVSSLGLLIELVALHELILKIFSGIHKTKEVKPLALPLFLSPKSTVLALTFFNLHYVNNYG